MVEFKVEKHFDAPPEVVFAYTTDLRRAAEWIDGIEELEVLTDGPVGKGTRFRETRIMFKKRATEEMEIVEFDPPRSYVTLAESHGCRYRSSYTMGPSGSGTDLTLTFEATPLTFMAKVMSVLMRPMMKSCLKMVEKDLEDLHVAMKAGAAV